MYNQRFQNGIAQLNLVVSHLRRPIKPKEELETLSWVAKMACEALQKMADERNLDEILNRLTEVQEDNFDDIKELSVDLEEFVEAEREILTRVGLDSAIIEEMLDSVKGFSEPTGSERIDFQAVRRSLEILQGAACNIAYTLERKVETADDRRKLWGIAKGIGGTLMLVTNASSLFPALGMTMLYPVFWKSVALGAKLIIESADQFQG